MDPLSIVTAVSASIKTVYSISTTLYTFITSTKKIDSSLEDLLGEVRGLTRVLEDIETFLKDNVIAQTSYATSRPNGAWGPILDAIQDTQSTLAALKKIVTKLGPPREARNGLKKAAKQVHLGVNLDEINTIKSRVHWHSTALQMALHTASL